MRIPIPPGAKDATLCLDTSEYNYSWLGSTLYPETSLSHPWLSRKMYSFPFPVPNPYKYYCPIFSSVTVSGSNSLLIPCPAFQCAPKYDQLIENALLSPTQKQEYSKLAEHTPQSSDQKWMSQPKLPKHFVFQSPEFSGWTQVMSMYLPRQELVLAPIHIPLVLGEMLPWKLYRMLTCTPVKHILVTGHSSGEAILCWERQRCINRSYIWGWYFGPTIFYVRYISYDNYT